MAESITNVRHEWTARGAFPTFPFEELEDVFARRENKVINSWIFDIAFY